ncbi:helix-turn-helix domain-containing protein [Ferrimicrobium acidiphilum]|uniref:helix-turn-helix domain-containing protein n=1 Tax=Ferrimicrobium acidiphilum TaxID=121039 RepID=UPI0023F0620B|nr:helix-turn-helix transcriptional regulator [Ferrimicrobium acidiphilum]
MPEEVSETTGNLIARYIRQKGWKHKTLADKIGRSVSWVSQVVRDEIEIKDIDLLIRIEDVLEIPRDELMDARMGPEKSKLLREQSHIVVVRKAIAGHPVPQLFSVAAGSGKITVDISNAERLIHEAWELIHSSKYQELGPSLASLIPELELASRTSTDHDKLGVLTHLANAYQIAAAMLAKVGDIGAGWVAADRAITAGERCNSRGLILAGQLRLARILLDSKDRSLGQHVLEKGIRMVDDEDSRQDSGLACLVGSCLLTLSIIHARKHEDTKAYECLRSARGIARKLRSTQNDYGTEFGLANVAMHEVAVAVELGEGQTALNKAKSVPKDTLSKERQARYFIDVARANVLVGSPHEAIEALLAAEKCSLQELSHRGLVATVIADIEHRLKHQKYPRNLRELKYRLYN